MIEESGRALRSRVLLTGIALIAVSMSTVAVAQDAQSAGNDQGAGNDIVVTAERTSSKLQTTPVAVSVLTGSQLAERGIESTRDLAGEIPNLVLPRAGQTPSTQTYFIRGIGQLDPLQSSAVGVYVDDVYIPRNVGSVIDLVDVSQVEVLRGPQGTLYGRNAAAGAISVQTRDLTDTLSGFAQIGTGNYNAIEASGYISDAIVPGKVRVSLAYTHSQRDGYTYDPTIHQHVNDEDDDTIRAKLELLPTDRIDILFSGDYHRDRSTQTYNTPIIQPGGYDPDLSYAENEPFNRVDSGGGSVRVTWKGDTVTVKSISAYRAFKQLSSFDNDGVALDILRANVDLRYHTFSQEIQANADFGRLTLVGGLFYYHEHYDGDRQADNLRYLGLLPTGNYGINNTDSYAAYLQGKYAITDRLTFTAGLRFTYESETQNFTQTKQDAAGIDTAVNFAAVGKDHWTKLTPKFGLDYKAADNLFLYASATEGFQVGGYDARPPSLQAALIPTQPESVWTYEAGVKASLFNHRARINVAAFYNDYHDLLLWTFDSLIGTSHLINAHKAHTYGLELETTLTPVKGIEWSNNFGYLDGKYDRFDDPNGPGTSSNGLKLPYSPKYTFRSGIDFTVPVPIQGKWKIGGDYEYQRKTYSDIVNTPQSILPNQNFFNLHANYVSKEGHWSVIAEVRNLGNKRYNQVGFYNTTFGVGYYTLNPPRLYTVSLRYTI